MSGKRTPQQISEHLRGRPWAQTLAGNAVPLVDTEAADIQWIDIITGLSYSTRYAGHARGYTIAQHSVLAAQIASREWPDAEPYALLHDAHEAYIGDITTPTQYALVWHAQAHDDDYARAVGGYVIRAFWALKANLDKAIFTAAGLAYPMPADIAKFVKAIDLRLLKTEVRDLMGGECTPWQIDAEPYPWSIQHVWDPNVALFSMERAINRILRLTMDKMSHKSNANILHNETQAN